MKTPHQLTALTVLLGLLLAGVGAWWWQGRPRLAQAVSSLPREAEALPAWPSALPARPRGAVRKGKPDAVAQAAMERCGEDLASGMREHAAQLAKRQDAKSQLAYALTVGFANPGHGVTSDNAVELLTAQRREERHAFTRARELDPTNAEIAWLAAERCSDGAECRAVQRALLQAEPDNLAAWIRAMGWARARKDDGAFEQAFQRATNAPRYDTHRGSALLAIMEGYAGMPTPESCKDPLAQETARDFLPGGRALNANTFMEFLALTTEHANVMLGTELRALCRAGVDGALATERQAGCLRIYSAMAGGETLLEQVLATSQMIELTQGSADAPGWRERYRQRLWMLERQRDAGLVLDPLEMGTNEVASLQDALHEQGHWPPPADWLPANERARSLIQTGRPPPETRR